MVIFFIFDHLSRKTQVRQHTSASADAGMAEVTKTPVLTLGAHEFTYEDDISDFLIIGTDHSGSYGTDEKGEDYHGEMADFLLVISVDDTRGTYTFLPINRDTMTKVKMMQTDGTAYASATEQICTAHWYGGNEKQSCENTVDAVSDFLGGLPFDGYYCIGMDSIKQINHSVGGVTVTVKGDFTSVDGSLIEGETIKLTDDQAYNYVHERVGMRDDNTNSARMQRQQDFLDGFIAAAKEKLRADPSFANGLYSDLMDTAVTDMNGHQVSYLINTFAMKENTGTLQIEGDYREGKILDDREPHGIFEADEESVEDCLSRMLGLVSK